MRRDLNTQTMETNKFLATAQTGHSRSPFALPMIS